MTPARQLPYAPLMRQAMAELCLTPEAFRTMLPDDHGDVAEIYFGFDDVMSSRAWPKSLQPQTEIVDGEAVDLMSQSAFLHVKSWQEIRMHRAAIRHMPGNQARDTPLWRSLPLR